MHYCIQLTNWVGVFHSWRNCCRWIPKVSSTSFEANSSNQLTVMRPPIEHPVSLRKRSVLLSSCWSIGIGGSLLHIRSWQPRICNTRPWKTPLPISITSPWKLNCRSTSQVQAMQTKHLGYSSVDHTREPWRHGLRQQRSHLLCGLIMPAQQSWRPLETIGPTSLPKLRTCRGIAAPISPLLLNTWTIFTWLVTERRWKQSRPRLDLAVLLTTMISWSKISTLMLNHNWQAVVRLPMDHISGKGSNFTRIQGSSISVMPSRELPAIRLSFQEQVELGWQRHWQTMQIGWQQNLFQGSVNHTVCQDCHGQIL